jgi:glycosyltransferase involved in cell wall biosynthesis
VLKNTPNKLILLTSDFPYGTGETFLETEIFYLCEGFDEVRIVSSSASAEQTRTVPENCRVERIDPEVKTLQKVGSLSQIVHPLFWKELSVIRKTYQLPLSKGILFTMLVSLQRGKRIAKKVKELAENAGSKENLFFLSYWCDDAALGLALAQERDPGIKTFCRIHRWDVYFDQSAIGYLPFRHYITYQLKAIFSISQDGIDYAKKVWKTGLDSKFHLSRLGINNERPLNRIERDHVLMVSCSNLIPVKRVHLIAEALRSITDQRIHWVHIGDGPERQRVEEAVATLPQNITVELKGRIPNPEIYAYYDELRPDLFVNVSASEGVPVSIMEAMSFGIPVIATDVGGNSEIVNHENGVLINNVEDELARAITDFMELNAIDQQHLSASSYQKWEKEYKAERNYREFICITQKI